MNNRSHKANLIHYVYIVSIQATFWSRHIDSNASCKNLELINSLVLDTFNTKEKRSYTKCVKNKKYKKCFKPSDQSHLHLMARKENNKFFGQRGNLVI